VTWGLWGVDHTAGASQSWFHISPHDLPEGTALTPGGGESPYLDTYALGGFDGVQDHVWMDRLENVGGWRGNHVYRVEPSHPPRLWDENNPSMGWVAPSARIVRKYPESILGDVGQAIDEHEDDNDDASTFNSEYFLHDWDAQHRTAARLAMPEGGWYHASPHELPVGTTLTPGGGESAFAAVYRDHLGPELQSHVWLADSRNIAGWVDRGSDGVYTKHVYRVEPSDTPRLYNEDDPHMGWVVPSARIVEKIPAHAVPPYDPFDDDEDDHPHTAARLASWHHSISHEDQGREGIYTVNDGDYKAGDLWYALAGGKAHIDSITVHPDYRGGGVGQSLIERLSRDFPDHKINPGTTTQAGHDFMRRMQQLPHLADSFDPDWQPDILPENVGRAYDQHHIDRLDPDRDHTASRLAMPAIDAYDEYDDDDGVPAGERVDHQDVRPGPYFHSTQNDFPPGHVLVPRRELGMDENPMAPNHSNWVWMSEHPADAHYHAGAGAHIYEVEPLGEGPWKWNKHPDWDDTEDGGNRYVSTRARIIRKIEPDENGEYYNWTPHTAARLAMPAPKFPDFGHQLPHVGPMLGTDPDDGHDESWWNNGGCGAMALAFKNTWPDLKIGAEIVDGDIVHHAWVHDGKHAHDAYGTHVNDPTAGGPTHDDGTIHMDVDPDDLADMMGVDWSEDEPWEDSDVSRAGKEIEHHWFGYDFDTGEYHNQNNQKEARIMTAAVTVYTKPDCPQCTMTKKQLDKLGIDHDTVDVTQDPDAHAYVTGLGYASAPVVVVNDGEAHWSGFRPDHLRGLVE